ncbi:unnamed protein product [Arctogadus glacialis]
MAAQIKREGSRSASSDMIAAGARPGARPGPGARPRVQTRTGGPGTRGQTQGAGPQTRPGTRLAKRSPCSYRGAKCCPSGLPVASQRGPQWATLRSRCLDQGPEGALTHLGPAPLKRRSGTLEGRPGNRTGLSAQKVWTPSGSNRV